MSQEIWSYTGECDSTLSMPLLFCEREVARYASAKKLGNDWDGERITFPMSRVRFVVTDRLTEDTASEFGIRRLEYFRFSVDGLQGDVFCWDDDGFLSSALKYTKWEGAFREDKDE